MGATSERVAQLVAQSERNVSAVNPLARAAVLDVMAPIWEALRVLADNAGAGNGEK